MTSVSVDRAASAARTGRTVRAARIVRSRDPVPCRPARGHASGAYLGAIVRGGLWLRDPRIRALLPVGA